METSTNTKIFKDTLISMVNMGAEYAKTDGMDIFFFINKDSEFNDVDKLRNCRDFLKAEFGLTLKVKYRK